MRLFRRTQTDVSAPVDEIAEATVEGPHRIPNRPDAKRNYRTTARCIEYCTHQWRKPKRTGRKVLL